MEVKDEDGSFVFGSTITTVVQCNENESADVWGHVGSDQGDETLADLQVERHLLQNQLMVTATQLREREDELHLQAAQMKEQDSAVAALQEQLHKEREKHQVTVREVEELRQTCHAQYTQNMELQFLLRQSEADVRRISLTGGHMQETSENGAAKFQKEKSLAVRLLKEKKHLQVTLQHMMNANARLEEYAMFQEDPQNSSVGALLEAVRQRDTEIARQNAQDKKIQNIIPQPSRYEVRSEASWDLPVHKTVLTTPEDCYIECKLKESIFGKQLVTIRTELVPVMKEFKDFSDRAVSHLWSIFSNKRSSYRPKEEFYKETTAILTRSKVQLAELLRRVNNVTKAFLKEEKEIKKKWLQQIQPQHDVSCECDFPPPPDPQVEALQKEVAKLKQRMTDSREEYVQREQMANMACDKAEMSLKFLQQRFYELHQELFTTLHMVYKHRFKWISRLPNPLRALPSAAVSSKAALDVQFNANLGAVISKDVEYLKKFGDYFASDDTFGIDMSAHCEERERQKNARINKERVERLKAIKQLGERGRRASAPVPPPRPPSPTFFQARQQNTGVEENEKAKPAKDRNSHTRDDSFKEPGTRTSQQEKEGDREKESRRIVPDWDMTRMESWRQKQAELWEKRRSLDAATRVTCFAHVNGPSGTSVNVGMIQYRNGSKTPPTPPPCARDDVFNRIVLRSRNLPLRPETSNSILVKRCPEFETVVE